MAKVNLQEVNIDNDVILAFKAKLNEVSLLLPFLVDLTLDERKKGLKIGPNRRDFVNEMSDVANNHPEILPQVFDKENFLKSILVEVPLDDFEKLTSEVKEKISDTHLDVGRIAYSGALEVYRYLNNVPGMDELKKNAKKYFEKAKKEGPIEE
ncbi:MAG: hypothetical protein JEY97_10990 [Bacteroidales bacterium]|nr:hypothetical protein [Bacteroidales bacterium]